MVSSVTDIAEGVIEREKQAPLSSPLAADEGLLARFALAIAAAVNDAATVVEDEEEVVPDVDEVGFSSVFFLYRFWRDLFM